MMMMVMMGKNRIRAVVSLGTAAAATRTFSTASPSGEDKKLYRRLSALAVTPGGSVAGVMDEWLKEGKAVTESKLVHIVKELRKFKSYKHALKVIDWMETKGFDINASIHAMRLDLVSKFKNADMAEKYFSKLPEEAKTLPTYGALLNAFCLAKMEDKALSLYEKMKELNFASTTLVANSIMTLYLKLGQHEKIPDQFKEMKAAKIPPDRVTYGILMSSYASRNDIDSIERVVAEINRLNRGGGVGFDWRLWCNLAGYYNSAGLPEKAESVLIKAEKMMPHERDAYHYLITLYAGAGNLTEVKRVWKLVKASFGKMTNMSYYHMLHALKKLGDLDGLKQCFKEWLSFHEFYDVKLGNVVIDAYLRRGMVKDAEKVWEIAISKGCGSDFRTLELFTEFYLERCEMGLVMIMKHSERFAGIAKQEKPSPGKHEVRKFLKHLNEVKDVEGLEAFSKSLKNLVFNYQKKEQQNVVEVLKLLKDCVID